MLTPIHAISTPIHAISTPMNAMQVGEELEAAIAEVTELHVLLNIRPFNPHF
jgi:hypothetical protein